MASTSRAFFFLWNNSVEEGTYYKCSSGPQSQGLQNLLHFFPHIARCWQQLWPLNLRLRQEDRVGRRQAISASSDVLKNLSVDLGQDLFQGHYFRKAGKTGSFIFIPFLMEVCHGSEHMAGFLSSVFSFSRLYCLLLNILGSDRLTPDALQDLRPQPCVFSFHPCKMKVTCHKIKLLNAIIYIIL